MCDMTQELRYGLKIFEKRIQLRPKTVDDAWDDYCWRKDPELAHLDAVEPTSLEFGEYYRAYKEEVEDPRKNYYHFSILVNNGYHIGNCMLYDINKDTSEAQLGILIGDRTYWDRGYGQEAVTELLKITFEDTSVSRVYLKTLRSNVRAQKCFAKCGFKTVGMEYRNGYDFIIMEINRFQCYRDATS